MARLRNPHAVERLDRMVEATRAWAAAGRSFPVPRREEQALWRDYRLLTIRLSRGNVPWDTFRALEAIPGWRWPTWLAEPTELRGYRAATWLLHFARTYGARVPGRREYPSGVTAGDLELVRRTYERGGLSERLAEMFERVPHWEWAPGRGAVARSVLSSAEHYRAPLAQVVAHVTATGHSFVASSDQGDLAFRVRAFRRAAIRRELPSEVRAVLNDVPGWRWDNRLARRLAQQVQLIAALRAFAAEFGHCRVPEDYHTPSGFPLGSVASATVSRQQTKPLPPALRAALDDIPGWYAVAARSASSPPALRAPRDATGADPLQRSPDPHDIAGLLAVVRAAAARYGHVAIPRTMTVEGVATGASVAALRAQRAHMNSDVVRSLESMPGWFWSEQHAQRWLDVRRTAMAAAAFVATTGHGFIPASYDSPDGYPLGVKVRSVAAKLARGTYDARHAALFAAIPGWSFETLRSPAVRVGVAFDVPAGRGRVGATPAATAQAHESGPPQAHPISAGGC